MAAAAVRPCSRSRPSTWRLWDLKAKRAGAAPVAAARRARSARALLCRRDRPATCRSTPCCARPTGNLERGFRAIKMKVGRPALAEDVERVARDAPAPGRRLPADGSTPTCAGRPTRRCARPGPSRRSIRSGSRSRWCPRTCWATRASPREGGVAVASGENLRSLWDFRELIARGGVSYPEPDVTNCGGVTAFMKIARLAEAFNLPVTSHGAHDVTVQLLAACPNRS